MSFIIHFFYTGLMVYVVHFYDLVENINEVQLEFHTKLRLYQTDFPDKFQCEIPSTNLKIIFFHSSRDEYISCTCSLHTLCAM